MSVVEVRNLIGGRFEAPQARELLDVADSATGDSGRSRPAGGTCWLDVVNPATGETIARVADSGVPDIEAAMVAAETAQPAWEALPASERAAAMERLADQIDAHRDELAELECDNTGKPLSLARSMDIPRASANLRFFAALIQGSATSLHAMPDAINYTMRRPLGVVGCISPWNLPLYLLTWKIAPALAAGNCVIAKPSELTPLTAGRLAELTLDAGFPPGVLNVVHGRGATCGEAIVTHPRIRAVSFTGGTLTGRRIAELAAPRFLRVSLELGGKNPTVVFADCDYQEALATTVRAAFSNQGQICLCGSRILVERPLYDRFREDFVRQARALRVGDPREPETQLGSMISRAHQQKVLGFIDLARAEGGHVLCGGGPVTVTGRCEAGAFVAPTVVEGLGPECRTNQEEIFGPVVTLQPFDDDSQALALANATPYGLAASVWTQRLDRAHRFADRLDAGVIWINCWLIRDLRTPFGGMKQSGLGREGGEEALKFFTEPKNICVKVGRGVI